MHILGHAGVTWCHDGICGKGIMGGENCDGYFSPLMLHPSARTAAIDTIEGIENHDPP